MALVIASYGHWEWAHVGVTGLAIVATLVVVIACLARNSGVGALFAVMELWGPPLLVALAAYLTVGDLRRAVAQGEMSLATPYYLTAGLLALWGVLAAMFRVVSWRLLRPRSSMPRSVASRIFRETPMAYHASAIAMVLAVSDFSMLRQLQPVPSSSLHDRLSESLRRASLDQLLFVEAIARSPSESLAVSERRAAVIHIDGSRITLERRHFNAVKRDDVLGSVNAFPEMHSSGAMRRLPFEEWLGDVVDLESTDTWDVSGHGIRHDQFVLARRRGVTEISSGLTSPFWSPFRFGLLLNPPAQTGLVAHEGNLRTLFFRPFRILVLEGGMALISCSGRFTLLVDLDNKQVAHFLPFAFGEVFAIRSTAETEARPDDADALDHQSGDE